MEEVYMTFGELREAELDFAKKKAAAEAAEKAREEGREEQMIEIVEILKTKGYSEEEIIQLLDLPREN